MARGIVVKNNFKKGLIVGIIVIFIGVGVYPAYIVETKSYTMSFSENILYVGEGSPDLVVDKITIKYNSNTEMNNYNTRIKNIGDTRVPGGRFFNLKTEIYKIGFDMSTEYYDTFTGGIITNLPLDPGESFTIPINCFDFDFPRFGFFQFNCIINEEKIIEESDYNNNVRTKTFFVIKIFPWLQFPIAFPVIWIPREG